MSETAPVLVLSEPILMDVVTSILLALDKDRALRPDLAPGVARVAITTALRDAGVAQPVSCAHADVFGVGFVGHAGFGVIVDADPSVAGMRVQATLGGCRGCESFVARVRLRNVRGARGWETAPMVLTEVPR